MIKDLRSKNINCHCERKRSNLYLLFNRLPRVLWTIAMTLVLLSTFSVNEVYAQTVDLSVWQNSATGLQTTSNTESKTAGLSTIIKASGIPFISLPGGVYEGGWSKVWVDPDNKRIEIGEIKVPGTSPSLVSQSADWAHNEMSFSGNLKVWISRLTPATLIQNGNTTLRLFSGNLNSAVVIPGSQAGQPWNQFVVQNRTPAPSFPKYLAYFSGGSVHVQAIPTSGARALTLPALDNNWLLVWYGNNSHFVDTKTPTAYSQTIMNLSIPDTDAYQADAPILLKFQNNPTSIIQTSEGGIDLAFNGNSGYTSMFPLFGREHLKATDTEGWGNSSTLPANVLTKINFWNANNRLCSYPTQVSETYAYNTNSDTSTISENINYLNVCSGGSTTSGFAILPPTVSLAKDALGTSFNVSGTLTDANYPTEFGPIVGIDNTNHYSYSLSGLKKYTDTKRVATNPNGAPSELITELSGQVDQIIKDGHYLPWIFSDRIPRVDHIGNIWLLNPADTLYHLSETAQALPDSQTKTNLINYIKSERTNYPPETMANLPNSGTLRTPYALNNYATWQQMRSDVFLKRVPLYNFLGLSRYYDLTGESVPATVINRAKEVLNQDMSEQDWASFSWFKGFGDRHAAVNNVNRHLSGLVGLIKLSEAVSDTQTEGLSRSLFAKAAIERLAMVKLPRYFYSSGIYQVPSDPNWQPKYGAGTGFIWTYNWISPYDDPNQVGMLDQFGVFFYDHNGFMTPVTNWSEYGNYLAGAYLSGYKEMIPETFRLMTDYDKADFEIYLNKYTSNIADWFIAYSEANLGNENNLNEPIDSFQAFLAKVFIQNETPQNLLKYLDVPWLDSGDFFYMQKLAETIKAYQGWRWEDQPIVTTPCTLTGASWGANTATVGNNITLNVTGTGNCNGQNIAIEVRRNGLPIIGDIPASIQPQPINLNVNGQGNTTWSAEFNPQLLGTNPQYYFRASLTGGNTIESNPRLLTVTSSTEGTPTPTPTPTLRPTITPTSSPTSTPTPTPAPCAILTASWASANPVIEGTPVGLNVTTSGACQGKELAFEVRRAGVVGPIGDSPVRSNPSTVDISGNQSLGQWIAEYQPINIFGVTISQPSYYFRVSLSGTSSFTTSSGPQLQVSPSSQLTITSLPAVTVASDSATIRWSTNSRSTSGIDYGLPGFYSRTGELEDEETEHAVSLIDLKPCATYQFRPVSRDLRVTNVIATGSAQTLTTSGCTGNAAILNQASAQIATSSGGLVNLLDTNSKGLVVDVPRSFASASANFQIQQLEPTAVLNTIGAPGNYRAVGNYLYRLNALADISSFVSSFDTPLTITVSYADQDISGLDQSTLRIYRHDGTNWQELQNCVVDTTTKTVTCQTTHFSDFALFGQPLPIPTSTPVPANNGGGNSGGGGGGGGGSSGGGGGGGSGEGGGGGGGSSSSGRSADLNHDGRVNITDLSIFLRMWGQGAGSAADLNNSGRVDITDLSIFLRSWSR